MQILPDAPIPPIRVVEMNTAHGTESYVRRENPAGRVYYWPSGNGMDFAHTAPGSDVEQLWAKTVTVTPLSYDLTDHPRRQSWKERLE